MTPEGWRRVHLAEVADQRTKKVTPTATDTRPYVALEHLAQGSPTLLGWREARTATSAKTAFCSGDVLFGKLRPNLRKAVPAPFDGLCSTDILPLFSKRALCSRYLAHLVQWHSLQKYAVATSSGTKMPRTSWAQLGEFVFSLPTLSEQRKIAAILSSVDDAIEKTQAIIDQVQIVKRGLMQELLTRGLPGRHTRLKITKLGELPNEWEALPIGNLCDVVRGSTPRPARDPKYFNGDYVSWITVGEVTKDTWPFLQETRTRLTKEGARFSRYLTPGTVILTNSGVTLGVPKLLQIGGCANDGIAAFQEVSPRLGSLFLYYALSAITDVFQKRVARGVGQPNLNTSLIGNTLIPVPCRKEQDEIVNVLYSCDCRIAVDSRYVEKLGCLKSILMSVLLSGELRVTPDTEAA